MKAKDYYQKYGERLQSPETSTSALNELIKDFLDETKALLNQRENKRGSLSDKACMAILEEMNNKWNALASMFPVEVLRRNGFKNYFMLNLEEEKNG